MALDTTIMPIISQNWYSGLPNNVGNGTFIPPSPSGASHMSSDSPPWPLVHHPQAADEPPGALSRATHSAASGSPVNSPSCAAFTTRSLTQPGPPEPGSPRAARHLSPAAYRRRDRRVLQHLEPCVLQRVGRGLQIAQGEVLPPTVVGWRRFLDLAPASELIFGELDEAATYWWDRKIPRNLLSAQPSREQRRAGPAGGASFECSLTS